MKKAKLLLLLFISLSAFSQKSINNYKYIIVAEKFEFLRENDKYQTSSLTKFLFNKNGFQSFLDSEVLPIDFNNNRCSALFADVKKVSSLFKTKVFLELKDCNRITVYKSEVGVSKIKEFKQAYHEAIRDVFKSVKKLNYLYTPTKSDDKVVKETKVIDHINKLEKEEFSTVEKNILYAQITPNGFQLVNTKPEKVFIILNTKSKNVFIIKGKNGVLYKKGGNWIVEFYENEKLIHKVYQIKF
mgnify:CR=1 FL=1